MTTTIDADWATKKARWMVEREIHLISTSMAPNDEHCTGLIEAFYAIGALTDQLFDEYRAKTSAALASRRRQLTAQRINRLLEEIRDDDQPRSIAR